jgi:hypothetical protein
MFIPDPGSEFYLILDPDPRSKSTGSRIRNTVLLHGKAASRFRPGSVFVMHSDWQLWDPRENLNEVLDSVLWIRSAFSLQMEAFCWIRCSGEWGSAPLPGGSRSRPISGNYHITYLHFTHSFRYQVFFSIFRLEYWFPEEPGFGLQYNL